MKICFRMLGVLAAAFSTGAVAFDWPGYQFDAAHSGYVPVTLDTSQFALRWQVDAGGGQPLNPVASGDGKVFVTAIGYFSNGLIKALDAASGADVWQVGVGNTFSVNPPAYAKGKVYLQTGASTGAAGPLLRAFDSATGQLTFQSKFAAQWERYYAPTVIDDTIYMDGGTYGGMYSFSAVDGSQNWFKGLNQYDQWTPAVDATYAYAYVGSYSPALYVLDRATGELAFSIADPNFVWNGWSMNLAPTLGGKNDVFAIHDGRLIRFDLANRKLDWALARGFTGQPSVAHGVVYAIDAGALAARDQLTGALLWSWGAPSDTLSGPLIVTDSHVLVSGGANIYAVSLASHLADWSYAASGALALAGHSLFVAASNGTLTALRTGAPGAYADAATTYLGTRIDIDVLANDDGFGKPVTVSLATAPQHGTALVLGSPGDPKLVKIAYTPADGFLGTDTFQYTVGDGVTVGTATVSVEVKQAQTAPDAAQTPFGTPVAIDVLKNDLGFADPATVTVQTAPAHGSAVVSDSPGNRAAIRITYTPAAGFSGADGFEYAVSDGVRSGSARVDVTVLSYKAVNDSYIVLRNGYGYFHVAQNDIGFSDPVTLTVKTSPNMGGYASGYSPAGPRSSAYIYYSPSTSNGPADYAESFNYVISDGTRSALATVTVQVVTFKAQDDTAITNVDDPVTVYVGSNDLGFDSMVTVGLYSTPLHGLVASGSYGPSSAVALTYQPGPGFKGTDSFQYAIDDGTHVGIATVTVNVIIDADHDKVDDGVDNCLGVANADQRDSDGDGFGNACDADLNSDGVVNFPDLAIFRTRFAGHDASADFDGNGIVSFADLAFLREHFGKKPGPSALHP
ncbi:MAG: PQQ-binding-like beta-propeller repeat protein [Gammaproteobacteria bacterium]|nr:PQQ-binding-like beta-propeller repeat protein [Gammaproteobacteria bacterium]